MTNPTDAAALLPCPFCGDVPHYPSGDGTQYEIDCESCGQSHVSVQICDLMTREERKQAAFTDHRYPQEFIDRAQAQATAEWNLRTPPHIRRSESGLEGLIAEMRYWQGNTDPTVKAWADRLEAIIKGTAEA